MKPDLSVLEKPQTSYDLVANVLGQAPQISIFIWTKLCWSWFWR